MIHRLRSPVPWILFLFVGMPLAIWVFVTHFSELRPFGSSNHGTLVQPIRMVPPLPLVDGKGKARDAKLFKGRWTLLVVAGESCGERCLHALYIMRQVQIAQGLENQGRLRYVLRVNQHGPGFTELQGQHPRLILCSAEDGTQADGLRQWLADGTLPTNIEQGGPIFVVDPLGNLMMRFDPATNPRGLIRDLARLLALSKIG